MSYTAQTQIPLQAVVSDVINILLILALLTFVFQFMKVVRMAVSMFSNLFSVICVSWLITIALDIPLSIMYIPTILVCAVLTPFWR